ncbi:hypothetical protein AYO45_04610 [Gammaproteobacteria bacterium SCGC AG-212-F23]|nr:hypothetical protein AYO45_04610 [Gammaproteobacteria bacterium SCGC AG-212-F23]
MPFCVRFSLPMDALEGTIWGRSLAWGYDKNPFLNGWLTEIAVWLGGHSDWVIYLFSQLSVGICFFCVWQLGKRIVPPLYALLAVLLLEGVQYYNIHSIDFNDNTLELGLWSLTILYFYLALRIGKTRQWLFTGIFASLSMMTKYYSIVLLLPMLVFLIIHQRKSFLQKSFYWGLGIFILMMIPHIIWLFCHDFITLNYAVNRVAADATWWNHIRFPLGFTYQQFVAFAPALVLFSALLIGNRPCFIRPKPLVNSFDKLFLLYVGLGPFFLTLLLSFITGMRLRAGWGQPLLSLWSLLLLIWLMPTITAPRFYRFILVYVVVFSLAVFGYCNALIKAELPSSANFPGKNIASDLTTSWHEKFHAPLAFVAGPRWLAGNIAFYSKDKPKVFIDWNKKVSPWIDEAALKNKGAIFVWDLTEDGQTSRKEVVKRFPQLLQSENLHFAWMRNKNMKPFKVIVAFLPPENDSSVHAS